MTAPQLPDSVAIRRLCPACRGSSYVGEDDCPTCGGTGIVIAPQNESPAAIRARLMLTLDEMAARLMVNRATVWRWEHGAKPRPHHMRQLAKMAKEETNVPN